MKIHALLRLASRLFNAKRVTVWLFEQPNLTHLLTYMSQTDSYKTNDVSITAFEEYLLCLLLNHYFIWTGKHINLPKDWIAYLSEEKILSKLDIPVQIDDQLIGVLSFENRQSQPSWSKEDLDTAAIIAESIASLIRSSTNEAKTEEILEQVQEASESKGFYLTLMSHEFRTPLNTIIGFTESLLMGIDGPLNTEQIASLQRVKGSAANLLSLVNDILDMAKLESADLQILPSTVDLIELAESCLHDVELLAKRKSLALIYQTNVPSLEISVHPLWMSQAIINLLSNAIKFTEKGSVILTINLHENSVEIKVADTGIGLSPEEIEKIFKPFLQGNHVDIQKKEGTGLGLAICQKVVDLHHGTITVESEKGVGSVFTIRLPLMKMETEDVSDNP